MLSRDALFNLHRVPREVVVDELVRELQIAAFPARVRAEHHGDSVPQCVDRDIFLGRGLLAGKRAKRDTRFC